MKKFDVKSVVLGFVIGTIGITTVFAANGIKSATFNSSKVYLNDQELALKNSLISVVKEGEVDAKTYMPLRELLETLGYNVDWNSADQSIYLSNRLVVDIKSAPQSSEMIIKPNIKQDVSQFYDLNTVKYTKADNGKIVITDGNGYIYKDVTTDEVWTKMNMQIFYATKDSHEEYLLLKDGVFEHLPGPYAFDGGYAQFCVSDLDNNGEYELLSIFHAGSGMDYQFLSCYVPEIEVLSEFGTVNNRFKFMKTDDQNVFIEFLSGEKARINLVQTGTKNTIIVVLPNNLSDKITQTLLPRK